MFLIQAMWSRDCRGDGFCLPPGLSGSGGGTYGGTPVGGSHTNGEEYDAGTGGEAGFEGNE